MIRVLLTLITADGCIGQQFLGVQEAMCWVGDPERETVQAIFTAVPTPPYGVPLAVLGTFVMNGDQFREFDESGFEAEFAERMKHTGALHELLVRFVN